MRANSIIIFAGARDRQGTLYSVRDLFGMYPDLFQEAEVIEPYGVPKHPLGVAYVRQHKFVREIAVLPLATLETLRARLDAIKTEAELSVERARDQWLWEEAGYGKSECSKCEHVLSSHGDEDGSARCFVPICGDRCGCECDCSGFVFKPGEGPAAKPQPSPGCQFLGKELI